MQIVTRDSNESPKATSIYILACSHNNHVLFTPNCVFTILNLKYLFYSHIYSVNHLIAVMILKCRRGLLRTTQHPLSALNRKKKSKIRA